MPKIFFIVHNVRSAHNVGSLLRTADGLGVDRVYLTGFTPHPTYKGDKRLPHESARVERMINKTALGAAQKLDWRHQPDILLLITKLKQQGVMVVAIEQSEKSKPITELGLKSDMALIVGSEIGGIDQPILKLCNEIYEIPMSGSKESLNVAVAGAIALYQLRYGQS